MDISKKLTKHDVNTLKIYIMSSYQYCKKVYNSIESHEHFKTWLQLCYAHLNNCNYWVDKLKPAIMFIPSLKCKLYKDIRYTCEFTIDSLQDLITEYNTAYEKQLEDLELSKQIEMRARIEHELAIEYREAELEKQKELIKTRHIGYNINKDNENDDITTITTVVD